MRRSKDSAPVAAGTPSISPSLAWRSRPLSPPFAPRAAPRSGCTTPIPEWKASPEERAAPPRRRVCTHEEHSRFRGQQMLRRLQRIAHDVSADFVPYGTLRTIAEVVRDFEGRRARSRGTPQPADARIENADRLTVTGGFPSPAAAIPPASRESYCSISCRGSSADVDGLRGLRDFQCSRSLARMNAFSASSLNSLKRIETIELAMIPQRRGEFGGKSVTSIVSAETMITSRSMRFRSSRSCRATARPESPSGRRREFLRVIVCSSPTASRNAAPVPGRVAAFTSGGRADGNHIQPVIEILTESSVADSFGRSLFVAAMTGHRLSPPAPSRPARLRLLQALAALSPGCAATCRPLRRERWSASAATNFPVCFRTAPVNEPSRDRTAPTR